MSFLAFMDVNCNILEVIWSDPVYLVMQEANNIKELIPEKERAFLEADIQETGNEIYRSKHAYSFIDHDKKQTLFLKREKSTILIFGCENADYMRPEHLKVIHRFMMHFKKHSHEDIFNDQEAVRFQFEKIQSLNSQLVDAERLLAKKNNQLHELNLILNNKLVKDALTGLVSRYQYRDEIENRIKEDPDKQGIFMFIDIDDFKKINDTYGHHVGDQYLIEFANWLRALPIENTIHMRIAGDEFGLFTYGLTQVDEEYKKAYWTLIKKNLLTKPFTVEGQQLFFSFSGGIAVYGIDTCEIYELIEYADAAMYKAKKSGKNKMASYSKLDNKKPTKEQK